MKPSQRCCIFSRQITWGNILCAAVSFASVVVAVFFGLKGLERVGSQVSKQTAAIGAYTQAIQLSIATAGVVMCPLNQPMLFENGRCSVTVTKIESLEQSVHLQLNLFSERFEHILRLGESWEVRLEGGKGYSLMLARKPEEGKPIALVVVPLSAP